MAPSDPKPPAGPASPPGLQITQLLHLARDGDSRATDELVPLVYEELRRLARSQLSGESPGNTLQPTALVHEAYMRLVGDTEVTWQSRGHFFGAAALAMRRILVERARYHLRQKRGGGRARAELGEDALAIEPVADEMIAIDEVLERLEKYDPAKGQLVMLRYFAGLTLEQCAAALGITVSQVRTEWAYARAWMHRELSKGDGQGDGQTDGPGGPST